MNWLGFDPSKCKEDWRTCGSCHTAVAEGTPFTLSVTFGNCGRCGFWRTFFGSSVCPHAPIEPVREWFPAR